MKEVQKRMMEKQNEEEEEDTEKASGRIEMKPQRSQYQIEGYIFVGSIFYGLNTDHE